MLNNQLKASLYDNQILYNQLKSEIEKELEILEVKMKKSPVNPMNKIYNYIYLEYQSQLFEIKKAYNGW